MMIISPPPNTYRSVASWEANGELPDEDTLIGSTNIKIIPKDAFVQWAKESNIEYKFFYHLHRPAIEVSEEAAFIFLLKWGGEIIKEEQDERLDFRSLHTHVRLKD